MEIITPQDYPDNARKRQRRSLRACDACRKRKTRCITKDGDSNCVHCQLRTTACTFQHDPPERQATDGASSNGDGPYSSDERHGLDEQQGPGRQGQSSSLVRKESRDETRTRVSETQSVQSYLSPAETRASGDSTRHHQAPSIIVPELIEPNPLDLVLGCSTSRFAELYGLGSHMEPILMGHYPYDALSHEFSLETHAIPRVLEHDNGQEYPLTFHMAADEKAVEPDPTHSLVDAIEACIRPYGPSLLELFWRHVHPSYPILCKDVFNIIYSQSYRNIPAALPAPSTCPPPTGGRTPQSSRFALHPMQPPFARCCEPLSCLRITAPSSTLSRPPSFSCSASPKILSTPTTPSNGA